MSDFNRPIIIKRKKVISGGGHHGGAWKVAYADFVTAMMAFFMLMWLLNATTEKQRKGLADYFSPTIPIARASGGGDGAMGGSSVFTQDTLARNGSGGLGQSPGVVQQALGTDGTSEARAAAAEAEAAAAEQEAETAALAAAAESLIGLGGDSLIEDLALKHVQSKLTDKGLVFEIFDLPETPLFVGDTAEPTEMLRAVLEMITIAGGLVTNDVAIEGFTRSMPIVVAQDHSWDLSTSRSHVARSLMVERGLENARMRRVTGHADRTLVEDDPMDVRNNRLEIIFLRSDYDPR